MSTEATGDGKPSAAGATGPETLPEGAEPTATAVDEPTAEVPRQAPGPDDAPAPEGAGPRGRRGFIPSLLHRAGRKPARAQATVPPLDEIPAVDEASAPDEVPAVDTSLGADEAVDAGGGARGAASVAAASPDVDEAVGAATGTGAAGGTGADAGLRSADESGTAKGLKAAVETGTSEGPGPAGGLLATEEAGAGEEAAAADKLRAVEEAAGADELKAAEVTESDEDLGADETIEDGDLERAGGAGDAGEADQAVAGRERDEVLDDLEAGEAEGAEPGYEAYVEYEEYAEYEVYEPEGQEGDGLAEAEEEYEPEEPEEEAEPPRGRRWPRVLLALGFVVLAAVIVGGAIAIVGSVTHGFKRPVKVTYKSSPVFSLKTGNCFNPQGQQSYTLVSCDAPHQAEVFATFALTGTTWPGNAAVQVKASDGCSSRLTTYVNPQLAISLSSTYVYPDPVAWQAGTRTVICEVRATSGNLTGSVRGATASAG